MGAVPIHLFTAQALNGGEQMAPTSKKCQAWVSGYLELDLVSGKGPGLERDLPTETGSAPGGEYPADGGDCIIT